MSQSFLFNLDDIEKKFDDMKEYYEENGYLIIENVLKKSFIDKLNDSIGIIENGKNRLQDEWQYNRYVKEVAKNKDIFHLLKKLYNDKPLPFQTLNFTRGTTQKEHSDLMHFSPDEDNLNLMCGVWYALEDITDEKGPLIYYPKSHKEEPILDLSKFNGKYSEYEKYLIELCKEKYVQQKGNIPKGSIIIWSSNLIHGGHPDRNKESTRKSMVVHYFFESSKYWWSPAISTKDNKNIRPDILIKSRAILR